MDLFAEGANICPRHETYALEMNGEIEMLKSYQITISRMREGGTFDAEAIKK